LKLTRYDCITSHNGLESKINLREILPVDTARLSYIKIYLFDFIDRYIDRFDHDIEHFYIQVDHYNL
jgi:hypothetical protein